MSKTFEDGWTTETFTVAGPSVAFHIPKNKFEWSFHECFTSRVQTEHAPCLFYRIMQKWILGIHWRKVTDE